MARTGKYGHENIAYQYRSSGYDSGARLAAELVEGWKNSPEHRHNMLLAAATETGVGIAQGEGGRYFAVQMFGRPKRAAIRFSVENRSGETVRYRAGDSSYELGPRVTRSHTVCRRLELSIDAPGNKEPYSVRPSDGARYTVTTSGVR